MANTEIVQQLTQLFKLQQIDSAIFSAQQGDTSIIERVHLLNKKIDEVNAEILQVKEQREELENQIFKLQDQTIQDQEKSKRWESRLYEIKNQREYVALSRELEMSKRDQKKTFDKIEALNVEKALVDEKFETLNDTLAEHEMDKDSAKKQIKANADDMKSTLDAYKEQREGIIPRVKIAILNRYMRIMDRRQGIGVSLALGGKCNACNMALPPQLFNSLMKAEKFQECPSCQRILIFEGLVKESEPLIDEATAEAEAVAEAIEGSDTETNSEN